MKILLHTLQETLKCIFPSAEEKYVNLYEQFQIDWN